MRSTPKKLLRGSNKLVYKAAVSNDTAAFLFYSRPTGAVHAAAQNMLLSVLLHPPKRAKKHRFPCPKTGAGCPPQTIDISECTFFAPLIYQFKDSHPGFLSCCSSTMYATFPRPETECLQNYCKIRRSPYDASQFSMQNGEVYMLHSFSSQVYSFQRRRQFLRGNKSNICTFFV